MEFVVATGVIALLLWVGRSFLSGQGVSNKPLGYVQPGTTWIEAVLADLGISRVAAPLRKLPEYQAWLEVVESAPEVRLTTEHGVYNAGVEPVLGDLYRVAVGSAKGPLHFVTLEPKLPLLDEEDSPNRIDFHDFYELTCDEPSVFGLFTPAVRSVLMVTPLMEIRDGRLSLPLAAAMFDAQQGEGRVRRDWSRVIRFLETCRHRDAAFLRLFQMAALDPDPWFRLQAATLLFQTLRGKEWTQLLRPDWPLAERRRRLWSLGRLPDRFLEARPDDLFAAVRPLLQSRDANPAVFAWDTPGSAQSPETLNRLRGGRVAPDDLFPEGWVVAAILFPEGALASPLANVVHQLDAGAAFLLEDLMHWLSSEAVDALLPGILANPAFRAMVLQTRVVGVSHRLDLLADLFFEVEDHELQLLLLDFFLDQEEGRLRDLVRRALPHILKAGWDPKTTESLLIATLRGLAEVGEGVDVTLIERCRSFAFSENGQQVFERCRMAIWKRAGLNPEGLLSVVEHSSEQGALSLPTQHAGDLSRSSHKAGNS